MLVSSGFVAEFAEASCSGCGKCARNCQFAAITLLPGKDGGRGKAKVNRESCLGCGVCTVVCPTGSVGLRRDSSLPEPLEV